VLLLSNMANTRTYVRLLRHLGVALIFAPEPFTTPFGVAFILAARHLSRRHEATVNKHLRETVQYYLAHTSHFGDSVDDESGAPGRVKHRDLSEGRPILGQITGSRSVEASHSVLDGRHAIQESTAKNTADMQGLPLRCKYGDNLSDTFTRTQKVIHHTIDLEWLSRRYESASNAVAHSGWTTTSGGPEGVTHHSVNMGLLAQHCGTGDVGQAKAKSHTINMPQLRQRYGSAASNTTVCRALQNNNCYYDMLSRRNVIGGY
jgi:hypothetical protein